MAVICSDGDLRLGGIAVGNKKDKFVVFPRCDVHRVIVGRLLLDVAPLICSKIDFFAIPHDFTMRPCRNVQEALKLFCLRNLIWQILEKKLSMNTWYDRPWGKTSKSSRTVFSPKPHTFFQERCSRKLCALRVEIENISSIFGHYSHPIPYPTKT